jgi:pyruvate dehydrogenase E2 component (dihydrolipoamide acetyltransferase)
MQIIMPKLGLTMTQGTITEWLKAPGDAVKAEEPLCAYETEKVTLELTAPEDGVLTQILAAAGQTVPAGGAVCEFRPAREAAPAAGSAATRTAYTATPKARILARELGLDLAALSGTGPDGRVQASDVSAARTAVGPRAQPLPPTPAPAPAVVKATPLARRIAAEAEIDLATVRGTGVDGTITREDVERVVSAKEAAAPRAASPSPVAAGSAANAPAALPPGAGEQVIAHSALRRTIAERMSASAFTAPHVTLMTEAEATHLVSARTQLNLETADADKISYNALIAALVARALREHPHVNARWEAEGIHLLGEINIALAVDTERGLLTPVLRGVDKLNLAAVQRGYTALVERALGGKSLPDDFAGGTFTVTNLGGLEIDGFTPIINPPQAAILGVGRIVEKPVARDGAVVVRPMVTLSLSFDHRIVDGAPAGRFLQRVKQLVERPMALLL